jgi:hypothetical protein
MPTTSAAPYATGIPSHATPITSSRSPRTDDNDTEPNTARAAVVTTKNPAYPAGAANGAIRNARSTRRGLGASSSERDRMVVELFVHVLGQEATVALS